MVVLYSSLEVKQTEGSFKLKGMSTIDWQQHDKQKNKK